MKPPLTQEEIDFYVVTGVLTTQRCKLVGPYHLLYEEWLRRVKQMIRFPDSEIASKVFMSIDWRGSKLFSVRTWHYNMALVQKGLCMEPLVLTQFLIWLEEIDGPSRT